MRIHRVLPMALALAVAAALTFPAGAQQQGDPDAPAPAKPAQPKRAPAAKPKPREATPKPPVPAPLAGAAKPTLLGQFGDWGAYTATPGGKKVCFALAKPATAETKPERPRNQPYMFISIRPAEKVNNEVSIIVGYPFKTSTEATAEVGTTTFALYTQGDGAWIKNAGEEAHMVDAMRSADTAVIRGVSAKGTQSTDTYTLKGIAQALERTAQECK